LVISKQHVQLTPHNNTKIDFGGNFERHQTQVLEIKYVINLGQLLKVVPNIKGYIFKLIKFVRLVQPERAYATLAINHQIIVIQI